MTELDFYSEKMKKAKEVTSLLTDYLNNFNYGENSAYFNEAMSREHRTLQQNFARLIFSYIEFMASDEYRTDGRNEASKQLAMDIVRMYNDEVKQTYGKPWREAEPVHFSLPTI